MSFIQNLKLANVTQRRLSIDSSRRLHTLDVRAIFPKRLNVSPSKDPNVADFSKTDFKKEYRGDIFQNEVSPFLSKNSFTPLPKEKGNFDSNSSSIPFQSSTYFKPNSLAVLLGILSTSFVLGETFSTYERTEERERMDYRLKSHGFIEKKMIGDGNCMFRAISDQLSLHSKSNFDHKQVRREIVNWLRKNESFPLDNSGSTLSHFLDLEQHSDWNSYCSDMERDSVWGDHISLVAASECFNSRIHVLSSVKIGPNDSPMTVIEPKKMNKDTINLYLSHWHENHYNSMHKIQSKL
jgi:hypothetical protein